MSMSQETLRLRSLRGPALEEAVLLARWHAKPNDLIGGWCVMPVDESPSDGCFEVADFVSMKAAQHIAELHNSSLPEGIEHTGKIVADALRSAIDEMAPALSLNSLQRARVYEIIVDKLREVAVSL